MVACPHCGETVGVGVLVASRVSVARGPWPWQRAAVQRAKAGEVRECVACGCRYTVCDDGRVVRMRGAGAVPQPAGDGRAAGGAGDGKGRVYDDDLGTLDGGPL